jgi:uncharacterized protein YjlB
MNKLTRKERRQKNLPQKRKQDKYEAGTTYRLCFPTMKLLQYILKDNDRFPNSRLPVLLYKGGIRLPFVFKARFVKKLFRKHHWINNWRNGVYTFHHYHSNTHEVMAVIKGATTLQLGGENGIHLKIEKGDVILIPACVAHCNLGREKDVICIGGYPRGKDYDMNYGKEGERPSSDENIAQVKIPRLDPVTGKLDPLNLIWKKHQVKAKN